MRAARRELRQAEHADRWYDSIDVAAWGWGCPSSPFAFSSWAHAIDTVARGLRTGYLDDGLTSVRAIHSRYAPVAAANDPHGLNLVWTLNVEQFLIEQGGNPSNVEVHPRGLGIARS